MPRALRVLDQADLTNEVVHFTQRNGQVNDEVDGAILALTAAQRLRQILLRRRLLAHEVFYAVPAHPVVCFTEATRAGIAQLVADGRYAPWAIGFTKDFVFQRGGGPVYYVRGDHWSIFRDQIMSPRLRAMATRYWPGEDDPTAPADLQTVSEYAHEREWRLPTSDTDPIVTFDYADVRMVVVPNLAGLDSVRAGIPAGALNHVEVVVLH